MLKCLALGFLLFPLVAHAQAAAGYVGSESCKTCHEAAFEVWQAGPHARATASLTGKAATDGRCLSCHAPEQSKGVAAVGCEICHGPGQYYSPGYVMKDPELARLVGLEDPGEKSCKVCHDASSPSLRPFDYKAKLPLIDHWSADKKQREAALANRRFLEKALGLPVEPAPLHGAERVLASAAGAKVQPARGPRAEFRTAER